MMQLLFMTILLSAVNIPNLAGAQEEVRLSLVPASQNRLSPDLNQALLHALEASAKSERATIVPIDAAEIMACEIPKCFPALGSLGATHALQIDATFANESYAFHLELWDVESRRSLGSDSRECAVCAAQDLVEDIALRARGLLKRAHKAKRADLVAPKPPLPLMEPEVTEPSHWRQSLPYWGVGLMAAGLGLGAVGAYYLTEDGKPISEDKTRVRNTKKPGFALVGAGAGALLAGAGLLTWHKVSLSATVALGAHAGLMATLSWPSLALP
jgi:hypothetical protein